MQDYDIHIFNPSGQLSLSVSGNYASDMAARRAAEHLCKDDEHVEVWSGKGCVFASGPHPAAHGKSAA